MTSYVFITGGVVSSLGKGITSACLGAILEARGLTISMIKLDPYINVDPGTMSPFQHGEVFVTHDGTETDLDLGHYAFFLKKLLQEEGVVPWMRDRLPLVYSGERLVAVGDLWLARDATSRPGIAVHWKGRPALH